jgi:hypothetical protein
MRFNYQPGKSQLLFLTGIIGAPVSATTGRIGYFNTDGTAGHDTAKDGLWFESGSTAVSVNVGKAGSVNSVAQSSWNLDRMNGAGGAVNPSGITIDWGLAQIFVIDFEWLGVGRVRFGLVVNGLIYYVHEFLHANIVSNVYMLNPNHSLRYEVRSTGGSKTVRQICSSIMSEGGSDPSGTFRTAFTPVAGVASVTTSPTAIVNIRLASTRLSSTIQETILSILGSDASYFDLRIGGTVAGTALSYASVGTDSAVEYAIGDATNTVTGGTILMAGFIPTSSDSLTLPVNSIMRIGTEFVGGAETAQVMRLCVSSLATTITARASLVFKEVP